ncbi:PQQ-dependent sugar dehydrogenase [bacterium]|nr:PQQ-dependent sugar dehydrogenase [bacterium]
MKKNILLAVSIAILAGLIAGAHFYWKNLRGAGPALKPPEKMNGGALLPFSVPEGFAVSLFVDNLESPRDIAVNPSGGFLVSEMGEGKITLVRDSDGDGKAEDRKVLIDSLNNPHGIALKCRDDGCDLYVAESHRVSRYAYDSKTPAASFTEELLDLPDKPGGGHFTRSLLLLDGEGENTLFISVGSSCNVCVEEDERRAAILALDLNAGESRIYAKGLRNAVFMDRHYVTGDIWATEMGRDFLGDDLPPDEINILKEGAHYGWPNCYGKNVHDADFDKNTYVRNPCMEPFETPSRIDIPAHSAPLGIAFIPEEGWPEDMWYDVLVAYHGSWNRTEPTGYKIVRFPLDAEGNLEGEPVDFMTGFLASDGAVGRPVRILVFPGGTLFVTDDKAGVIYRVYRTHF